MVNSNAAAAGKAHLFLLGLVISLICAFFLSIIFGTILYFTNLSETFLPTLSLIGVTLSLFVGSATAAKISGTKGLLLGLSIGFAFILINIILSLLFGNPLVSTIVLKKSIICLLAGGLGGVFGVTQS